MISVGIPSTPAVEEPELPSLEATLLGGEHPTEVADLLWARVNLTEAPEGAPAMSAEVLADLVSSRDAEQLRALGEKLPTARVKDLTEEQVLALAPGLVRHPLVSSAQLEVISDSGLAEAVDASDRVNRVASLVADLDAGRDPMANYLEVARRNEVSAVTEALASSTEAALVMLGTTPAPEWDKEGAVVFPNVLPFRAKVINDLGRVNPEADELIGRLLGVLDDPAAAVVVDEFLAQWLCDSESAEAELARALLVPEGGVNRSSVAVGFVDRLTAAGRMRLRKHDDLWDLVAYKVKERVRKEPRKRRPDEGVVANVDQLMAYKLAEIDVTPQFLSSNMVVDPDEFTMLLEGISPMAAANFLVGQTPRKLEEGQVDLVLDLFDEDDKELLFDFVKRQTQPADEVEAETDEDDDESASDGTGTIVDKDMAKAAAETDRRADAEDDLPWHALIANLPWRDELVRHIPNALQEPAGMIDSFNPVLTELLGDDAAAWAKALDVAPTWTGSLVELADAVR